MPVPVRATIDADSRLIVRPKKHGISWLTGEKEVKCVIDVLARALVRLWPLSGWAAEREISEDEAEQHIQELKFGPLEPGTLAAGTFVSTAKRKDQGKSSLYQIELPDMAVFSLFDQGTGPMAVRKGRSEGNSGKVLLIEFDRFVELWGHAVL